MLLHKLIKAHCANLHTEVTGYNAVISISHTVLRVRSRTHLLVVYDLQAAAAEQPEQQPLAVEDHREPVLHLTLPAVLPHPALLQFRPCAGLSGLPTRKLLPEQTRTVSLKLLRRA